MRKIPTLFRRDPDDRRHVTDEVTPGCGWVLDGEGVATRKYDGTCVMFDGHDWWARRQIHPGKPIPDDFDETEYDEVTGKRVGWVPIEDSPFAKYHAGASGGPGAEWEPGTYELVGPKINRNPDRFNGHKLVPHAKAEVINLPPVLDDITIRRVFTDLGTLGWEGIVWHHPDGRMAKLKVRDLT